MMTRIGFAVAGVVALILASLAGCGDGDPAAPGDSTPPGDVADLHIVTVDGTVATIAWTAPGDDGDQGTAAEYDIRYATDPITAGNWGTCTQAASIPDPAAPGTEQSAAIDVGSRADVHIALRTADEVPNWSGLSNVATASIDIAFQVEQLTSEGNNIHPCLSDGRVVWIRANSVLGDELYVANLEAAIPVPECLTDNGGLKEHPNNHGSERIVWQGRESSASDWEIWVYDAYQVPRYQPFTDNDVHDCYPDLAGGGSFAWLRGSQVYGAIHYWNASGHDESIISDGCCPTSEWGNEPPSADDYAVVWRANRQVGSPEYRAYLWQGALTNLTDELDATMAHNYSLHGGEIAYEYGASPAWIRYWDGTDWQEVAQGYEPSLHAGAIAYEVWDGHDWEIRYWDGATIHEITDNDYNDTQASLHGSLIAWVGRPPEIGLDQIFYVELAKRSP